MEEAFFNSFFQFFGRLFTIGFHIQNPNIFGFLPVFPYIQIEASTFDFDGEGREFWADSWVRFALLGKALPFMKGDDGKEGRIIGGGECPTVDRFDGQIEEGVGKHQGQSLSQ
jgi:hypothetical protein